MKILVLLSLYLLAALTVAQQNDYTVQFDTMEIISYNKDLVENPTLTLFRYNDSSQAINASGTLKKDLGMDIKVNFEAQKLQENNEYKVLSSMNDVGLCELINSNKFGLKDLLAYGNFTVCPWKANFYVVNNAMLDVTKLPASVPVGKYLVNIHYFSGTTEIMHTKFAGSIAAKS